MVARTPCYALAWPRYGPTLVRPTLSAGRRRMLSARHSRSKYRHAASRGKTFIGNDELLLRLRELGSGPVAGVSAHGAGKNFYVYLTPATLEAVGALIMYDAQSDKAPGDLAGSGGFPDARLRRWSNIKSSPAGSKCISYDYPGAAHPAFIG